MNLKLKTVEIIRCENSKIQTIGILLIDGNAFCNTLELPWKDNRLFHSCIPEGLYYCELYRSGSFGKTYRIVYVENRTGILFHWGNYNDDTKGCIILGGGFKEDSLTASKIAFDGFMKEIVDKNFKLIIKNA